MDASAQFVYERPVMSKSRKTYLISDTHFGHKGSCEFHNKDGRKMRPWDDEHKMNADMIEYWNDIVNDEDVVYHLGDVVINRRYLGEVLPLLKGRKRLIGGNHDIFKLHDYTPWFEDIKGCEVLSNPEGRRDIILSHIPLHVDSVTRFGCNVHGHYHANYIDDPHYLCVCVEQINYRPIEISVVRERIAANKKLFEETGHVTNYSL